MRGVCKICRRRRRGDVSSGDELNGGQAVCVYSVRVNATAVCHKRRMEQV